MEGAGSRPGWDAQSCHKQVAAGQVWRSLGRADWGGGLSQYLPPPGSSWHLSILHFYELPGSRTLFEPEQVINPHDEPRPVEEERIAA